MMDIRTYSHAKDFLADTLKSLMQEEAVNNLMIGLCLNMSKQQQNEGIHFYALINEKNEILGCCIQTDSKQNLIVWAEKENYELFVQKISTFFQQENLQFPGVLGPKELALQVAKQHANHLGLGVNMHFDQGVYELRKVIYPQKAKGFVRFAEEEDIPLISQWIVGFLEEALEKEMAYEQAHEQAKNYIEQQKLYVWEHHGVVSMTVKSRPTPNGIAINHVYTPKDKRGNGYASNLVAEISRELLKENEFCTLFTDLANPTSNGIYQRMGYRQVANFATYLLR